jgi:hypothetical protein
LPFLALVAFQDGIYWIKDLPEHEASHLLLNIMPRLRDVEAVQLSALNNAAQGAFNLGAARTDDVR